MKSGTCPKCEGTDVVRVPGKVGAHGAGSNITVGPLIFGAIKVTRFVCLGCGYLESWVEDDAGLETLGRSFPRVE